MPHFRIFMSKIQLDFGILPLILFHIQNFNYITIPHLKVACHQLIAVNSAAACFFFSKGNERTVSGTISYFLNIFT